MVKVRFTSYYKYQFFFEDDLGNFYFNDGDPDEIYRLSVGPEMEVTESDGKYFIDGLEVTKQSK